MEALEPLKVISLSGVELGKSYIPHCSENFHYQTLLLQPKPDVLDTFSLLFLSYFYFFLLLQQAELQNCESTSHSISISNGLALLSTTLFPDSFSSLQLAEQRIRINWIRQKKVFCRMACKYYLFSLSSGTQQLPVPALHWIHRNLPKLCACAQRNCFEIKPSEVCLEPSSTLDTLLKFGFN